MPWHRYTARSRRLSLVERMRYAVRILSGGPIKFSVTVYTETEVIMIDDGRLNVEKPT